MLLSIEIIFCQLVQSCRFQHIGGKRLDYHSKVGFIVYYLIFVNLMSFLAFLVDKNMARKKKWRIPEKSLMTLAIFGGSLGSLIGMHVMRHKTQKKKFTFGIPVILVLQILVAIFYFKSAM